MQWLVPDVPKFIQNKIDHERYIDQRERWASKVTEDHLREAAVAAEAVNRLLKLPNASAGTLTNWMANDSIRPRSQHGQARVKPLSDNG